MFITPLLGASQLTHLPSGLNLPAAFVGLPNNASRGIRGAASTERTGDAAAEVIDVSCVVAQAVSPAAAKSEALASAAFLNVIIGRPSSTVLAS
jgi:hypothetical protein